MPSSILKKTPDIPDTPLTRAAVATPVVQSLPKKSVKWNVPKIAYYKKYKCREFEIQVEKLSDDFILKARLGHVDWKQFFRDSGELYEDIPSDHESIEISDGEEYLPRYAEDMSEEESQVVDENASDDWLEPSTSKGKKKRKTPTKNCDFPSKKRRRQAKKTVKTVKDLKQYMEGHRVGLETIKCKTCGSESFTEADNNRHVYESHEGPKVLPRVVTLFCKACKQEFTDEKEFDCHILNHVMAHLSGYKCTLCSQTFQKYSGAALHVKTHVNYKCTFCSRTYNSLDQVERHCDQSHKNFGRPFSCNLCDFRSAVFGLLIIHREDSHAVVLDKQQEKCKFCGEANFIFSTLEVTIAHLAQHANNFHLYKCKECDFTADDASKFIDHSMEVHISCYIADEDVCVGPDISGLLEALAPVIKRKFGKTPKSAVRTKPTFMETQSAVAGILNEDEETGGSKSFISELDKMPSVLEPTTSSELIANVETPCTSTCSRPPKRRAFVKATNKLKEDATASQESRIQREVQPQDKVDLPLQPDPSLSLIFSPSPESPFERDGTSIDTSLAAANSANGYTAQGVIDNNFVNEGQMTMTYEPVYDEVNKNLIVNGKSPITLVSTTLSKYTVY